MKKKEANPHQVDAVFRRFFYWFFPVYFRFYPFYLWLCMWSAPYEPAKWYQYFGALRITLRSGKYHSKKVLTIKIGCV